MRCGAASALARCASRASPHPRAKRWPPLRAYGAPPSRTSREACVGDWARRRGDRHARSSWKPARGRALGARRHAPAAGAEGNLVTEMFRVRDVSCDKRGAGQLPAQVFRHGRRMPPARLSQAAGVARGGLQAHTHTQGGGGGRSRWWAGKQVDGQCRKGSGGEREGGGGQAAETPGSVGAEGGVGGGGEGRELCGAPARGWAGSAVIA